MEKVVMGPTQKWKSRRPKPKPKLKSRKKERKKVKYKLRKSENIMETKRNISGKWMWTPERKLVSKLKKTENDFIKNMLQTKNIVSELVGEINQLKEENDELASRVRLLKKQKRTKQVAKHLFFEDEAEEIRYNKKRKHESDSESENSFVCDDNEVEFDSEDSTSSSSSTEQGKESPPSKKKVIEDDEE